MTRYVWAGNPGKEKRDWIARINRAMTAGRNQANEKAMTDLG